MDKDALLRFFREHVEDGTNLTADHYTDAVYYSYVDPRPLAVIADWWGRTPGYVGRCRKAALALLAEHDWKAIVPPSSDLGRAIEEEAEEAAKPTARSRK